MSELQPDHGSGQGERPVPPRRRRRRFGGGVLVLALLAGLAGGAALLVLSGRAIEAPQWLSETVAEQINARLPEGRVTLGRLVLQAGEDGLPGLRLLDLGIFDGRGSEIARLNEVGARVSFGALLRGELRTDLLRLSGAQMTLRRKRDGTFDLSFGEGARTSGTFADVVDAVEATLDAPPLGTIGAFEAVDLTITIEDARSGRLWQITDGALRVKRTETGLDLSADFDVFNGTEELAETVLGLSTNRDNAAVSLGISFRNAAAADIALQAPALSFLGVLEAPISGALRADFDSRGAFDGLDGTLEIGAGALQPTAATPPVRFDSGKAYFSYDPEAEKITFSEVSVNTDAASLVARGQAYLRDKREGWPSALLGQFTLEGLELRTEELFEQPIRFSRGAADFRMRLAPFSVEVGQLMLAEADEKMLVRGRIAAAPEGWELSADMELNRITTERLFALWPALLVPNTRKWLLDNLRTGVLSNVRGAARIRPGQEPRLMLGYRFSEGVVRFIRTLPELTGAEGYATLEGRTFSLALEKGVVTAPLGGQVDMAGSSMRIPDVTKKPARAEIFLDGRAPATAILSLLNEPPFRILRNTDIPVDVAEGEAAFRAEVAFDLRKKIMMPDVSFDVTGELRQVRSERLVPGRVLSARRLELRANPREVEIFGPVRLGLAEADARWRKALGPGAGTASEVTGTVRLSQGFVEEFGIGLPKGSVDGAALGQFRLELPGGGRAPRFSLLSDLNRVGLRIDAIGWSKPKNRTGRLEVVGHLGDDPKIESLEFSAPGLRATGGQVTLAPGGAMERATFERVRLGGWLDAPVTLVGRGPGADPGVVVQGGTIDIRKTDFASAGQGGAGSDAPITLAPERVVVTESITLTGLTGEFSNRRGLSGAFTARINGGTPISGQVEPQRGGTAVRIRSDDAGGVLRDSGVFDTALGGRFDMTLNPTGRDGVYRGTMSIANTRVRDAPALTELLSAISIVGLLDQLGGPGITFTDVKARFELTSKALTLRRFSAVGPSLGITLEGRYDMENSRMNMQGVLSPVYFLNAVGQVFTRRGEGLFGFSFRLRGPRDNPRVSVNPLSILTPGMFREIFRTPPPQAGGGNGEDGQ